MDAARRRAEKLFGSDHLPSPKENLLARPCGKFQVVEVSAARSGRSGMLFTEYGSSATACEEYPKDRAIPICRSSGKLQPFAAGRALLRAGGIHRIPKIEDNQLGQFQPGWRPVVDVRAVLRGMHNASPLA